MAPSVMARTPLGSTAVPQSNRAHDRRSGRLPLFSTQTSAYMRNITAKTNRCRQCRVPDPVAAEYPNLPSSRRVATRHAACASPGRIVRPHGGEHPAFLPQLPQPEFVWINAAAMGKLSTKHSIAKRVERVPNGAPPSSGNHDLMGA